jgi:hypothetical protein
MQSMTIPHAHYDAHEPSFDDLETTEPDLRLTGADRLPDDDDPDGALAFMEAKTEPARPVDHLPETAREEPRRAPSGARDEALLAFLETVRRVFGHNG